MPREPILIPDRRRRRCAPQLTDREEVDPDFVIGAATASPCSFVNVVDDLEMGITHVIRGEDHLSNTAKHIALFKPSAWSRPSTRTSRYPQRRWQQDEQRDRGASLTTYLDEGFLPEAVNNYLCLSLVTQGQP